MGEWLSDKLWLMESAVKATSLDYLWMFTPNMQKLPKQKAGVGDEIYMLSSGQLYAIINNLWHIRGEGE